MTERPKRREAWVGGVALVALALATLLLPWLADLDPYRIDLAARLEGPSRAHVFGRDALGRDLLARLCFGGRISLAIATAAVGLSL